MLPLMLSSLNVLYKHHKHVAVKIESTWGTERCDTALHEYLIKNRLQRLGFCPSVYKEILNLYILHKSKYGSKYTVLEHKDLNVYVEHP